MCFAPGKHHWNPNVSQGPMCLVPNAGHYWEGAEALSCGTWWNEVKSSRVCPCGPESSAHFLSLSFHLICHEISSVFYAQKPSTIHRCSVRGGGSGVTHTPRCSTDWLDFLQVSWGQLQLLLKLRSAEALLFRVSPLRPLVLTTQPLAHEVPEPTRRGVTQMSHLWRSPQMHFLCTLTSYEYLH